MNNAPEFIRGNQKSYIRVSCESSLLECYEYKMCMHNHIGSFLEFQQRSENGKLYMYYEISGMQSLDIYLHAHKLKRNFAIQLANALLKLSREVSEYALDLEKIIFTPRYIMVTSEEELRFIYDFIGTDRNTDGFENLLETGIDHMDYQDELLMTKMFQLYERYLEQKSNFLLEKEVLELREMLMETQIVENMDESSAKSETEWTTEEVIIQNEDKEHKTEKKIEKWKIKKEILIILVLDVLAVTFWKPLTILKIFFAIAVGVVMMLLNQHAYKKEKGETKPAKEEKEAVILEEYEDLIGKNAEENNCTQFIVIEESDGILYSLQEREPKYIYIDETSKLIGKDSEKVQIVLGYEGISRLHAIVVKEGKECMVEDLNSTNGTKINEETLEPRKRYVLQQGDKVSFAGVDYIFR